MVSSVGPGIGRSEEGTTVGLGTSEEGRTSEVGNNFTYVVGNINREIIMNI
jgi:hypothetical protein